MPLVTTDRRAAAAPEWGGEERAVTFSQRYQFRPVLISTNTSPPPSIFFSVWSHSLFSSIFSLRFTISSDFSDIVAVKLEFDIIMISAVVVVAIPNITYGGREPPYAAPLDFRPCKYAILHSHSHSYYERGFV